MTYLFVGAGGIGASVAARLAEHAPVTIADGWPEHVAAMRQHGLTLTLPQGDTRARVHARRFEDVAASGRLSGVDAVFVSVKSFDTSRVLQWLLPLLGPTVPVVSLQNGLNEPLVAEMVGERRTVGAVVMFDGIILEPGRVRTLHPEAALTLGSWPTGRRDDVERLAGLLSRALPVVVSEDIRSEVWAKLIVNCMVNAPSAASGLALGELARSQAGSMACAEVAREAVRVAVAVGARVDRSWLYGVSPEQLASNEDGPRDLSQALRAALGDSDMRPSMLTDVERRRPTEIDALNGLVLQEGRARGIDTPWNEHFVEVVRRIERGQESPDEKWLSR
jgi:2-dehydropantoate 2-reductase